MSLNIDVSFLAEFLEFSIKEPGANLIDVPWPARNDPEGVGGHGVEQTGACGNRLNNIPTEGVVGAILERCELHQDNREE